MEEVLDLCSSVSRRNDIYEEPYDEKYPVVCLDEKPYQLTDQTNEPLPVEEGKPQREDYTYKRKGTCNLFVALCPQGGYRHVEVTGHRKAKDYADFLKELVDIHFPEAIKIRIVQDNLNTHKGASLYKRFSAEEARRIYRKLEFHYTPKHASWLNMAEIEIHVLGKQCIDRRIGDVETLKREIAVWKTERNQRQVKVNWQFTTKKARVKLERAYNIIKI